MKILCLSKRWRRRKIIKINRAGRYFLVSAESRGERKISDPSPTVVNWSTRSYLLTRSDPCNVIKPVRPLSLVMPGKHFGIARESARFGEQS